MVSKKIGLAAPLLIAMVLVGGFLVKPAFTKTVREETLRFTIVERTPQYVLATRSQERVVVWKGHRYVVQHGVVRFRVVRITRRYAYLQRVPTEPDSPTPTPGAILNVGDYGAKGDGVSNDHAALSRACAAASALGGTVYLPAGTYTFSTRLTLPNGVNVKGTGAGSWLNGPVSVGSSATYADLKIGRAGYATYIGSVSGVTFSGVRFAGGGGSWSTTWPYCDSEVITMNAGTGVSDILFDSCEVEANAGSLSAPHPNEFQGVMIYSGVKAGQGTVHDVLFRNTHFGVYNGNNTGGPEFGVVFWDDFTTSSRVQGTKAINFEGCTFEAFQAASIDFSGASLSSDGVTPASGYSHITGCTFKGDGFPTPYYGNTITIEKGAGYVTISGNTFYRGSGAAVGIEDSGGHNTVTNNVMNYLVPNLGITHSWNPLIGIASSHNTVTGNTLALGTECDHIINLLSGANSNVVTGNTITFNTGVYGSYAPYGIRNLGSGNTVSPNTIE